MAQRSSIGRDDLYERKRESMVREAARAFAKAGYADTSLDVIANSLQLTKPALYYYFKDKNELLYECHVLVMTMAEATLREVDQPDRSGADRLLGFIHAYTELITRDLGSSAAVLAELNALKGDYRKAIIKRRDAMEHKLVRLAKVGIQDGSIRDIDPQVLIFLLMGAVNWVPMWFDPTGRMSGKQVAATLEALCATGLRAR